MPQDNKRGADLELLELTIEDDRQERIFAFEMDYLVQDFAMLRSFWTRLTGGEEAMFMCNLTAATPRTMTLQVVTPWTGGPSNIAFARTLVAYVAYLESIRISGVYAASA